MFWRSKKTKQVPAAATPAQAADPGAGSEGDLSTTQFLTGDSSLDRRSVEVLLEAIAGVSQSRDLDALLTDIVDRSIEITNAERGLLILREGEEGYSVRVARNRGGEEIVEELRFSTSVVKKVMEDGQPIRATVQSESDALELGRSVFDLKLRAVMSVPLMQHASAEEENSQPQGVLYVDSRAATRSFDSRDLSLFAALSQHISIALENARLNLHSVEKARLEQSLELASAIQGGLMPSIPKNLSGFEVHGWYRPAERTSGDFFDFVRTRDGRLAVVVGDVTGHGIGPALVTATAQASLRSYLRVVGESAPVMTLLNQDLSERMDPGMFVTLLLLVFTDDGRCEIVNAGHTSPLVWRKETGAVEAILPHTAALGMIPDAEYEVDETIELRSGDLLLAYTDGLAENHPAGNRDELFGDPRVHELLAECGAAGRTAEQATKAMAEAALEYSGGEHDDDITLVVVRRL